MYTPRYAIIFRRYAPFNSFGMGFGGDGRDGPSTSLKATARTSGVVAFDSAAVRNHYSHSDGTHHTLLPGVEFASVAMTVTQTGICGPGLVSFTAHTAGGNPRVPKSPDIDTYIKVLLEFGQKGALRVSGEVRGDNFPNLEVFLHCFTSRHAALLVDGRTEGGRNTGPFARLYGSHENQVLAKFDARLMLNDSGALQSPRSVAPSTM